MAQAFKILDDAADQVLRAFAARQGFDLSEAVNYQRRLEEGYFRVAYPALVMYLVWLDRELGRPLERIVGWAEKKWFGGWDDMHKMRFNQPEEDDGFFVYTFVTEAIFLLFLHVDELWEAGFQDALPPARRRASTGRSSSRAPSSSRCSRTG